MRRLNHGEEESTAPCGLVLRQCIEPLGLTIAGAAAALEVKRTKLSELVNEKRGISPENGRAIVQGVRRQRRKLAYTASAL
jgi:plasmid maintenance system antidote protein VapI